MPTFRTVRSAWITRYSFAVLITALVIFLKQSTDPYIGNQAPFLFVFIGVLLASWYGGLGPGLVSTFLTTLALEYLFLNPNSLLATDSNLYLQLAVFAFEGLVISALSESSRLATSHLSSQAALYEKLLQAQSDLGEGVVFLENEKIVFANAAARKMTGYETQDFKDLSSLFSIISPEKRAEIMARTEKRRQGEKVDDFYETTIIRKDGEPREIEIAVKTFQIGKVNHLILLTRDITERKITEQGLRKSEEHYRLLVENVKDYAIFTLKKNGQIASWNEGAERILGYEETEVIGQHFSCLFNEHDIKIGAPEEELRQARNTGRAEDERWHVRKDGTQFYSSGTVTPLLNNQGQLRGYIKVMQDITARRQAEEKMEHQALHDSLTNLPNRILFIDRLTQAISVAERNKQQLAVMFLDLDQFKNINDTLGHSIGDLVLQNIAQRLTTAVRKEDTVARLGGDEFTILAPELSSAGNAAKVAKKVFKKLHPIMQIEGHELNVNTSLGIALYPEDGTDVQTLLKNADTALYQAKSQGRNTFQFYSQASNYQTVERLSLEADLGQALDRSEFVLYYQPIYRISDHQIASFEALVRWKHPRLGLISPNDFIPLAEERGMIVALNDWILKTACRENKAWQKAGFPPRPVAVNISARQFAQKNLVEKIKHTLQETNLESRYLQLEITESFAMQNIEVTIERLKEIKEMGISVSIDDFGSGHSSLNYLKRLPVNILKIDKTFINECSYTVSDQAIITAIISLAHSLNLEVIAEGVESRDQLTCLTRLNCDEVQGFLFSEPLPADKVTQLFSLDF